MGLKSLIFDGAFEIEVKEAMAWYKPIGLHLPEVLRKEIQECLSAISRNPTAWAFIKKPYRHKILSKFPYSIIYFEEEKKYSDTCFWP